MSSPNSIPLDPPKEPSRRAHLGGGISAALLIAGLAGFGIFKRSSCSGPPVEHFDFHLEQASRVSLVALEAVSQREAVLLDEEPLAPGPHQIELRAGELLVDHRLRARVPPGRWAWRCYAHQPFRLAPRGILGQPQLKPTESWPRADGPPSSVVADSSAVYLGSSSGSGASGGTGGTGALIAYEPRGQTRWVHQRKGYGVQGLGVDRGVIYVLADVSNQPGGPLVYKLDAKTGELRRWADRDESDLLISGLWSSDAADNPVTADQIAVGNGRIYLSFTKAGFIAVLDEESGRYVTTLTGPEPSSIALSVTPIKTVDGQDQIADFGVAVLSHSALSYFLMPHDPPWVAANTSHWLAADEKISAFTMRAQTMTTGEIELYVALAPPQAQVQMRSGADPSGFLLSVGTVGGRSQISSLWNREALGDVRSLALDGEGNLWIAEANATPRRFSSWTTTGKQGALVREIFPPQSAHGAGAAINPAAPECFVAAGCEWKLDFANGEISCLGVLDQEPMEQVAFRKVGGRWLLFATTASASTVYERRGPGDWVTVAEPDWKEGAKDNEKAILAQMLPESDRASVARADDGRAFALAREGGIGIVEIEGAQSLHQAGAGEWRVGGPKK